MDAKSNNGCRILFSEFREKVLFDLTVPQMWNLSHRRKNAAIKNEISLRNSDKYPRIANRPIFLFCFQIQLIVCKTNLHLFSLIYCFSCFLEGMITKRRAAKDLLIEAGL